MSKEKEVLKIKEKLLGKPSKESLILKQVVSL